MSVCEVPHHEPPFDNIDKRINPKWWTFWSPDGATIQMTCPHGHTMSLGRREMPNGRIKGGVKCPTYKCGWESQVLLKDMVPQC